MDEERLVCFDCFSRLLKRKISKELCLVYTSHRLWAVICRRDTILRKINVMDRSVVKIVLQSSQITKTLRYKH